VQAGSTSQTATNFGPFSGNVGTSTSAGGASASQNSQISPTSILASGTIAAYAVNGPAAPYGASSQFSVTFALAEPSTYSVNGSFSGVLFGSSSVTLSVAGGATLCQFYPYGLFSTNGILPAGQYVLSIGGSTAGYDEYTDYSYSLDFEVAAVQSPFQITSITVQSNNVLLTWNAYAGMTNMVQAANGRCPTNFSNISTPMLIPLGNPGFVVTNYVDAGGATNLPSRFYRIVSGVPLVAGFTGYPTSGSLPLVVTFTDASTGAITNWFWGFGDGTTTNVTTAGIAHTYNQPGTYTVDLTISGPLGSTSSSQTNLITVAQLPGTLQVSPSSLDFGQLVPGTASQQVFVVSNIGGAPIMNGQATVSSGPFVVASGSTFSLPIGGSNNIAIRFQPSTSGSFAGTVVFSSEYGLATSHVVTGVGAITNNCVTVPGDYSNPVVWGGVVGGQAYAYEASGLVAYHNGCQADPDGNMVSGTCVSDGPGYHFSCDASIHFSLIGQVNDQCIQLGTSGAFVAPSSGTLTLLPNDDAGIVGNGGAYTACIAAITASPPTAQFTANPTNGFAPFAVTFADSSAGTVTNHLWDFGDGFVITNAFSTAVTHIYSNAGVYSVTLTVVGPLGSSTDSQPNLITVAPLTGALRSTPVSLNFLVLPGTATQEVFAIENIGGLPITNGQAVISGGPFTVTSGTPFGLPNGESTNVVVQFAPSTAGSFTNLILFTDEYGFVLTNTLTGTTATTSNCVAVAAGNSSGSFWGDVVAGTVYQYTASGQVSPDGGLCRVNANGQYVGGVIQCAPITAGEGYV